jgi:hypothetical protein
MERKQVNSSILSVIFSAVKKVQRNTHLYQFYQEYIVLGVCCRNRVPRGLHAMVYCVVHRPDRALCDQGSMEENK